MFDCRHVRALYLSLFQENKTRIEQRWSWYSHKVLTCVLFVSRKTLIPTSNWTPKVKLQMIKHRGKTLVMLIFFYIVSSSISTPPLVSGLCCCVCSLEKIISEAHWTEPELSKTFLDNNLDIITSTQWRIKSLVGLRIFFFVYTKHTCVCVYIGLVLINN